MKKYKVVKKHCKDKNNNALSVGAIIELSEDKALKLKNKIAAINVDSGANNISSPPAPNGPRPPAPPAPPPPVVGSQS